jgi:cell division control protein 6
VVALSRSMNIDEYLREKEEKLERSFGRVKDLQVFDFSFVPPGPLMRAELKPVIDALVRYEKTGIANNVAIIGSRGCGKTVSVLYLQRLLAERGLTMLYVNCRQENTSYKILARLLRARARGVSFTELAERFSSEHTSKTVVVLDEVDLLSEKDKNKDILYFLSRSPCNYMTILLSNSPRWPASLDLSVQSTLQPEHTYFAPYSTDELVEILTERAHAGLHVVDEGVLAEIAALTSKYTSSDVRVAIKTLYYWAVEPQVSIDAAFQNARRDVVVDVIRHLSDKNLLILKAASIGEKPVKEIYENYRRLCAEHRDEPFSYVYFLSSLGYLQSLGLILLISTKVQRSYTKRMHLTFPMDVFDAIWRYRFAP